MTTEARTTTCIGSLPHHNVDAALEYSFRAGIPFLPQIPIRNPWEFMIPQALEGVPGLQVERDGTASLNVDIWESRAGDLNARLAEAFSKSPADKSAFEGFEPGPAVSSLWQPFVWELSERRTPMAKVQIAGPLTSQWSIRGVEGSTLERLPELASQIYRLVLARALAMTRRLQAQGIQPVLFIDEPALYGLSMNQPRHMAAIQELKLMIQTLRKEGVITGLHCCSNTDWATILSLGLGVISVDAELSLKDLLSAQIPLQAFIRDGGRLSLGVIPTARSAVLRSLKVPELFAGMLDTFASAFGASPLGGQPELVRKLLIEAFYTPACGLALHSVPDAELVLETLNEFHDYVHATLYGRASGSA